MASGAFAFGVDESRGHPYMAIVIQRHQMRILIYLLAMLTGFSAAEAARPVSSAPTLVGTTVDAAYAVASVKVSSQAQVRPLMAFPAITSQSARVESCPPHLVDCATTPIKRNDINHS